MCFDVVKGMLYLQSKGIIHRDLASRNLLLDENFVVKISDFGMSRKESFYKTTSREIPYRWAAPEVYQQMESTSKSDCWSFAICCWEIMMLGKLPYEGISNKEVARRVANEGLKLTKPPRCSEDMFALLSDCWNLDPELRPTFKSIYKRMIEINPEVLTAHQDTVNQAHLKTRSYDVKQPEYMKGKEGYLPPPPPPALPMCMRKPQDTIPRTFAPQLKVPEIVSSAPNLIFKGIAPAFLNQADDVIYDDQEYETSAEEKDEKITPRTPLLTMEQDE
eukprot:TRINITY_DN7104_c0_g1_i2.p1 TRINITY_DN7104_c0_g1~~TRINITY_DN7104_c0_g1_i2.p1  ORF type:complete len:276 (-),score=73.40 TRINITY_DN7104_c0_g1_i2:110-937(-)